jgi:hypothetical protein
VWKPESLGQYHDIWAKIVLSAPDKFRGVNSELLDQKAALRDEFARLREGFRFARPKLKAPRMERIAEELIEMSYEAYATGDSKTGAHALQECEGLIWSGRRSKPKYVVEAERRAFGDNLVYAGIKVSPYPYEGSSADVMPDQAALLALAEKSVRSYLAARRDFKFFAMLMDGDHAVRKITRDPDDVALTFTPLQKSYRATYYRLKELAGVGAVRACIMVQVVGPLGSGITCFDIEQPDAPRVSARQMFKLRDDATRDFAPMRFHLEDREWFPEGA